MIYTSSLIIQPIKLFVSLSNRLQFEKFESLEILKIVFIQFENFDPISCGVLFFIYCDLHVELRIKH